MGTSIIYNGDAMVHYPISKLVQNELCEFESELASFIPPQVEFATNIQKRLILADGKRLRPALFFICARSGNSSIVEKMPIAMGIELIHVATLIHGDILDNALVRLSIPTVHSGWGNSTAILAGDFLFEEAFSLVLDSTHPVAIRLLSHAICAICEGEILQIRDKFNPDQTEEDYLKRTDQKTANLIAVSCELGAASAGADAVTIGALRKYGQAIGMAFQIVGDLFDIISIEDEIEKPVANDLRKGVLTFPVIVALKHSQYRKKLRQLILTKDMSFTNLKRCLAIVREPDIIERCNHILDEYLKLALKSIPRSLELDVQNELTRIAELIVLGNFAKYKVP